MTDAGAVALLREVCALMLAYGEPGPDLAAWCERMMSEPGAAERALRSIQSAVAPTRD